MPERVSYKTQDVADILLKLNLNSPTWKIFSTQRGSVILAEDKGELFTVKIADKSMLVTEQNIYPSRSCGLIREIEVAELLSARFLRQFVAKLVTERFVAVSFKYVNGCNGFCVPRRQKSKAVFELFRVLDQLHALGVAHCDIQPANVIFKDKSTPILIDFELSKKIGHSSGTYPGKSEYLSPESAIDIKNTGFISRIVEQEVYSLGVSSLGILAGHDVVQFPKTSLTRNEKIDCIARGNIIFNLFEVDRDNKLLADRILQEIKKPLDKRPKTVADFLCLIGMC